MNTCGTCKFFGPVEDRALLTFDEDTFEPKAHHLHVCQLLQHLKERGEVPRDVVAGVVDGSGYYAALCVSEDFGCNQWQPLTPSEKQP